MAFTVDGSNGLTFPDSTTMASATQLGLRNRIINGAMVIDQRNAGALITPTNDSTGVDRWKFNMSVASKYTAQQVTDAPSGFSNSLKLTSSSAYTVGASELFATMQPIEGFNFYDLSFGTASASAVTISFWVKSSLTGNFGGSLSNYAQTRFYPFSYSISSANTWERKTITIAGDTGGTWVGATNAGAAYLWFSIGAGSSFSQTAGAWTGSSGYSATGSVSVVGTNAATWQLTGVQLERGSAASPFDWRPYPVELAMCQRYYSKTYMQNVVPATDTVVGLYQTMNGQDGNQIGGPRWKQTMRAAPTVVVYAKNGTAASISATNYATAPNAASWVATDISDDGARIIVGTGGLTAATAYNFHYTASAEL